MKTKTAFALLASLSAVSAIGCGSSKDEPIGKTRASLHRAKNCGDLLTDLKADASYKVNRGTNLQMDAIQKCIAAYGESSCAYGGYVSNDGRNFGGQAGAESTASPAPADSGGGTTANPNGKASSYSETNNQVKGVDEADIVKTDGTNLYVLHGRAFKVLQAWPATELKELSSFDIEGQPSEMFVSGDKVVVYSQVNGAALYTATGLTPKSQYADYGGGVAAEPATDNVKPGMPGGGGAYVPLTKITVLTLTGAIPSVSRELYFEGNYLSSRRVDSLVRTVLTGYAHGPQLKYSVYELYPAGSNGTSGNPGMPDTPPSTTEPAPAPAPSDGVKPATSSPSPYPTTGSAMIAALEQLRSINLATIAASQLSDWIPNTFVKNGTAVQASTVACEDFYVPTAGSTESGITEVVSLDLANPTVPQRQTAILGRADTVYRNTNTIYLAARAWLEVPAIWGSGNAVSTGGGTAVAEPTPAPPPREETATAPKQQNVRIAADPSTPANVTTWSTNATHVHKFEFTSDPQFPNYVASGTINGNVKDQFSLDEKDGKLRIATTESRIYISDQGQYVSPSFEPSTDGSPVVRPQMVNHVYALGQNNAFLDVVGDVGELAPNEQVFSARFVGNRGYVVTFRRKDPLFVVDLANPASPTLLAALTIPGFSEYMHPLDETHLLTIGRDADSSGMTRGLQLQIFDVADGANPQVVQKYTYLASEYGSSSAEYDHKAFTYFADKQLLAFPYYSYGETMRNSLELFKVATDTGFQKVGSVDSTALTPSTPGGYCGGYYGPDVRRGVFLEDFVYSISYGGVVVKDSRNLAAAGKSLPLSSPTVDPSYGGGCAVASNDGGF